MRVILPIIFCMFCLALDAQITFQKSFDGSGSDVGKAVCQTNDGGYVITGWTNQFGSGGDIYLIKTDSLGTLQWAKNFGGTASDGGFSVQQTHDNGYAIAGSTSSFGAGEQDFLLIKTDNNGIVEWSKTYGGTSNDGDGGVFMQQTDDKGFIMVGSTYSYGVPANYQFDIYIVKTDSAGSVEWTKTFGEIYWDGANSVQQTADGGFIIGGSTQEPDPMSAPHRMLLLKIAPDGSLQWAKKYIGVSGGSARQTMDGGYIALDSRLNTTTNRYSMVLMKTDGFGNFQWAKTFADSGHTFGTDVQQINDGSFIVFGGRRSLDWHPDYDAFLIKTDSVGILQWSKLFSEAGGYGGKDVDLTNDGGFVFATSNNYSVYGHTDDVYLIKTDANGNSGCNQSAFNLIETSMLITDSICMLQSFSGGIETSVSIQVGSGCVETTNCLTVGPSSFILSQMHANVLCYGQCNGTVILTAIGGSPPYIFSGSISGLCAGTYTYTVTDSNGFTATTTATITQPAAINVSATAADTTTLINSNTDLLTGTPTGGIFSGMGVSGTNFDPSIAGVGTWPVTYIYTDGNGCSDTATINITVNLSTGITINEVEGGTFEVYPNPTYGIFTVNLKHTKVETKICVYDALGKCVLDKMSMKTNKEKIDLTGQPKGLYSLEIESTGVIEMKKIVLQ